MLRLFRRATPLALLLALVVQTGAQASTVSISMVNFSFTPDPGKLKVGDTVKWTNVDATSHQVVADGGAFASVALKTNDTYSFTFAKSGDFKYHDTFSKAKGEIVVTAAPVPVSVTAVHRAPGIARGPMYMSRDPVGRGWRPGFAGSVSRE